MSTVKRSIVLNDVEPAPLSLRVPMGMETWVELFYRRQDGKAYGIDVAGQLQLTARTTNTTTTYAAPATDSVNGKARAVIPAGDISDVNGYRVRLLGTVNQQPQLLAMGTLMPIAGVGPEAMPTDVIDSIDLTLSRSVDATIIVRLWHDEDKSNPYDLSTVSLTATIVSEPGGATLTTFAVATSGNQATLTMPMATIVPLPDQCWWTLTASASGGAQTLAQGNVTVTS